MGSKIVKLVVTAAAIYTGQYYIAEGTFAGMTATGFGKALLSSALTSVVTAGLSKVFGEDKKASLGQQLNDRTRMVKQPLVSRDTVYGLTKKSGAILFMESTNNNQNLHMIVQLASHESQSIEKVYFNDEELTLGSAQKNQDLQIKQGH